MYKGRLRLGAFCNMRYYRELEYYVGCELSVNGLTERKIKQHA